LYIGGEQLGVQLGLYRPVSYQQLETSLLCQNILILSSDFLISKLSASFGDVASSYRHQVLLPFVPYDALLPTCIQSLGNWFSFNMDAVSIDWVVYYHPFFF
jgi:hypothetical protein